MVLSGMNSLEQMEENIRIMGDFQPLSQEEQEAVEKVREVLRSLSLIPCTSCRYCTAGCPPEYLHPGFLFRHEHQADLPRLERGFLLQ